METKTQKPRKSGFAAIVGRPNSGKSTLLNRVLGAQVSIVTPKAQTTRERVLGILTEDRGQLIFSDTPGIHTAKAGGINACMVEEARLSVGEGASVVWYLVDPRTALEHEQVVLDLLKSSSCPIFVVLNKMDLVGGPPGTSRSGVDPLGVDRIQAAVEGALTKASREYKTFRVSGEKGGGVGELLEATWACLPEGPIYYPDEDQISDRPMRFFASEKIREQLYLQLGDELPYSCAVEIEKYEEDAKPVRIEAVIHVERDSQKGMVIGKGAIKIKAIGIQARRSIELFTGHQVFLGLKVKVLKEWSRDADALKRLGYNLPASRRTR
jgi:GTP-binding protein Era